MGLTAQKNTNSFRMNDTVCQLTEQLATIRYCPKVTSGTLFSTKYLCVVSVLLLTDITKQTKRFLNPEEVSTFCLFLVLNQIKKKIKKRTVTRVNSLRGYWHKQAI